LKKKPFARQLQRVRKICLALPETMEKISHGEPTFFVNRRVFAMFSNNHHNDGHVAVWLPAPSGLQAALIDEAPETYYRPPYVGGSGWVGIELDRPLFWAKPCRLFSRRISRTPGIGQNCGGARRIKKPDAQTNLRYAGL
jgi:hypothetical protein